VSSVPSFFITSLVVSRGNLQMNSAFRTRQSRLFTWSARIAPASFYAEGIDISKGIRTKKGQV
jgi:hypothetical protein